MNRGFGSDNHSGAHPELINAFLESNTGHAPSYGTDAWSEKAQQIFQKHFGEKVQTYFVFNGTAANVLSLRALVSSFQSVLASDVSHLNVDECGAPEFFTGSKLIAIPTQSGKITIESVEKALIRGGDQHFSQPKALSLTQPTEYGTVYSMEELKQLISFAKSKELFVHLDGARIANSVVELKTSFKEMTTDLGVDIVSFGGTKNGFLFGEAIVILNSKLNENFKYIRKQSAQLPSKSRFIAAQFEHYLATDLWQRIALHECTLAEKLYQELRGIPSLKLTRPRQSNAVFVVLPKNIIKLLREKFFFYVWDEKTFECRLMTSWDTQENDITAFVTTLKGLL